MNQAPLTIHYLGIICFDLRAEVFTREPDEVTCKKCRTKMEGIVLALEYVCRKLSGGQP